MAFLGDHQHLIEKPRVDPVGLIDALDADPPAQQGLDLEQAVGRGDGGGVQQLVVAQLVVVVLGRVAVEAEAALFEATKRFLQALGEGPTNGHDLAHRLHLRTQHTARAWKLLKGPTRDLGDDIVDARLEAGRGHLRDVVRDLIEGVPHREPGCDLGDRETGGL